MKPLLIILSVVLLHRSAVAGDSLNAPGSSVPGSFNTSTLSVRSSPVGARVYCDTLCLGITPLDSVPLPTGVHVITFVHPDAQLWQNSSIVETLTVHPSESVHRTVSFPFIIRVSSDPFGATVRIGDSVVGSTPLLLIGSDGQKLLTLSKEGYGEVSVAMPDSSTGVHVSLHRLATAAASAPSPFLAENKSKGGIPLYVTTGAAVVGGIVAAYCKIKADSYYDDYLLSGRQETLRDVRRLDTIAGISLGASQVSLLALCYFLISR